jgi:1,4-alpha-glucan branching enzyme
MDAAWHDWLGRVLHAIISHTEQAGNRPDDVGRLCERLDPNRNGYGLATRTVTFVSNHDYPRPMTIIGSNGNISGDAAFRRMKLGHGLLLTAPGIPMIWMGTEFGMPGEKTLDPMPVKWELLDNPQHADLLEHTRKLIAARHANPALSGDNFQTLLCDQERQLIAFKRWTDGGGIAVVVANLRDEPAGDVVIDDASLPVGTWLDPISGWSLNHEGGKLVAPLGPSEIRLLIKQ